MHTRRILLAFSLAASAASVAFADLVQLDAGSTASPDRLELLTKTLSQGSYSHPDDMDIPANTTFNTEVRKSTPVELNNASLATKYGTKSAEIVSYLEVLEDVFGSNITYSASVTRGEFAIILSNLIEHLASEETGERVNLTSFIKEKGFESDYVVKNSKYKNAVTTLHYFGITQLDNGQFNDDKTLNRGQLASFLSRIYAINFDQFK